jgi:hypothetical protein
MSRGGGEGLVLAVNALFSDEHVAAVRAYLEANKGRFKVKNQGS